MLPPPSKGIQVGMPKTWNYVTSAWWFEHLWENKTSQILPIEILNEFWQLVGHVFAKDHSTCSDELGVETTSVPWRQTPVVLVLAFGELNKDHNDLHSGLGAHRKIQRTRWTQTKIPGVYCTWGDFFSFSTGTIFRFLGIFRGGRLEGVPLPTLLAWWRNFLKLSSEKTLVAFHYAGWMFFFHPMSLVSVFRMYFVQLLSSNIWKWSNLSWISFCTWRQFFEICKHSPTLTGGFVATCYCPPWHLRSKEWLIIGEEHIFLNRAKHQFLFYRMLRVQNASSRVVFLIILSLVPLGICKKTCECKNLAQQLCCKKIIHLVHVIHCKIFTPLHIVPPACHRRPIRWSPLRRQVVSWTCCTMRKCGSGLSIIALFRWWRICQWWVGPEAGARKIVPHLPGEGC